MICKYKMIINKKLLADSYLSAKEEVLVLTLQASFG